jgi:hypothetical protein
MRIEPSLSGKQQRSKNERDCGDVVEARKSHGWQTVATR